MTLDEITKLRIKISKIAEERSRLGGFDQHAEVIVEILTALRSILDYLIAKERAEAPLPTTGMQDNSHLNARTRIKK